MHPWLRRRKNESFPRPVCAICSTGDCCLRDCEPRIWDFLTNGLGIALHLSVAGAAGDHVYFSSGGTEQDYPHLH
jgi:hypothetical protein